MKNIYKFALVAVIIIGFFLRFYQLGSVPKGLEWDEVAIGYDSYSIIHTGRDQFGSWFPITFRSLDDYKPPLYNYFAILPIFLFGLNDFAVRFPSAFFGSISVFGVYLLVKELFRKVPKEEGKNFAEIVALLAAFFFAVSPWHLQFSRAAFEVNLSLTFIIYGVYSFLRGLREKRFLSIAAVCFGMGLFSYHSSRVVVPALLGTLIFLFRRDLQKMGKKLLPSVVIMTVFVIAFLPIALSKEAQIRLTVTNFINPAFPYGDEVDYKAISAAQIEQDIKAGDSTWGKIFHNRRIAGLNYDNALKVGRNYLMHFSPEFLFVRADMPLHHAPGFGLLYIWDLPFLIIGLIFFLKNYRSRYSFIILMWLLVAPIPASITRQAPHAVRTELITPTFPVFAALGVYVVLRWLWKEWKLAAVGFGAVIAFLFAFNVGYYFHQYYVHTNYEVADKWFADRKDVITYVDSIKGNYKKVIVSTKLEQPHAFFLFYLKYDPATYLKEGGTASGGWAEDRNKFDKYEFKPLNFSERSQEDGVLFVGLPEEFPQGLETVKTFYYPDGREAVKVVGS